MYKCSETRMKEKINTMRCFGDTGKGGITRYTLSDADVALRLEFSKRMKAIGCEIKTDDFANMYAILAGSDPSLPAIVMGSHSDSVQNGGNYDGILGVMGAMEVLETIVTDNIPHTHNLVTMIWTNEEGSLYLPVMMSSGVICHDYLPENIAKNFKEEIVIQAPSILDSNQTFSMALDASGLKDDRQNRLSPKNAAAMFELHIEQGPILESASKDIGVVNCVAGMISYRIQISGQSDHAGTTPMSFRKDALYGAAQAISYLHDQLDTLDSNLVYTTGYITCHPNITTVIPDYVEFSLEARHVDPNVIKQAENIVKNIPNKFAKCSVTVEEAWTRDTVYFDENLVNDIQTSADLLGYSNQIIHSGAGHDAQFAAYMLPTAMIFVPSKDGHSHCELEYTSVEQCTKGVNVLLNAVLACDKEIV